MSTKTQSAAKAPKQSAAIAGTMKAFAQVKAGTCRAVDAVRYVADHYPSLTRAELLKAAEANGINLHTANTQFYGTRAGRFGVPLSLD